MRQMLLHIEAFEHRCLSTQKHLPREALTKALTYTHLCTQKLLDTDGFSENHRSFDTEKPLHRESFTHRSFYTHKLFHRSFYTEKLLSTSFYTQTSLQTEGLYTQGFYAQKLLHREAFTHRRFPTEKPIPQSSFYTLQKVAILRFWRLAIISCEGVASGVGKSQFLTLDNHFAWNGLRLTL